MTTGATGFIGRHLVDRLLAEGRTIRILSHTTAPPAAWLDRVDLVRGSVGDAAALDGAVKGIRTVFHLAGRAHDLSERRDTGAHSAVTLAGTRQLLDAAGRRGVERFVFVSSLAVYGPSGGDDVRDETSLCHPTSPYGRAKLDAERAVFEAGSRFGMHVVCLRPALVYGPGCKGNLPRLIRLVRRGFTPPLPFVGGRRSVVDVRTVVDALLLAGVHPAANGRMYIVADPIPYSTREILQLANAALGRRSRNWTLPLSLWRALGAAGDLVVRVAGRRLLFDSQELDKLVGSAVFSADRITRELNFAPTRTLAASMTALVRSDAMVAC